MTSLDLIYELGYVTAEIFRNEARSGVFLKEIKIRL